MDLSKPPIRLKTEKSASLFNGFANPESSNVAADMFRHDRSVKTAGVVPDVADGYALEYRHGQPVKIYE